MSNHPLMPWTERKEGKEGRKEGKKGWKEEREGRRVYMKTYLTH